MRWNLIKEAWNVARKKFPDVKKLFIDLPEKFRCEGQCAIYDLDKPDEPIGIVKYHAHVVSDSPILLVSLDGEEAAAAMARFGSIEGPIATEERILLKKASINAKDIASNYPDTAVLGEQIAYLAMGHEDGPLYMAPERTISEDSLTRWARSFGFEEDAALAACDKLVEMGVNITERKAYNLKVAKRPKKKKHENFSKVRIIDPASTQLNEGGQVIDHKRDEKDEDYYLVIVDGSSEPSWYHEDQIDSNDVSGLQNLDGPK